MFCCNKSFKNLSKQLLSLGFFPSISFLICLLENRHQDKATMSNFGCVRNAHITVYIDFLKNITQDKMQSII